MSLSHDSAPELLQSSPVNEEIRVRLQRSCLLNFGHHCRPLAWTKPPQNHQTALSLGLELGGNAAFLVFPTADLDLAVTICPFFACLMWFCSDLTLTLTL